MMHLSGTTKASLPQQTILQVQQAALVPGLATSSTLMWTSALLT
jgi:hypothetical protein